VGVEKAIMFFLEKGVVMLASIFIYYLLEILKEINL
jgi:hypothetical protein